MKVICYVRRTKLWAEEYKHSELWVDRWRADRIAQIWDQTFTTRYVDFRRRLNQLQQENLQEVPFDRVVNQYDYVRDDSVVVPTDDDDWFHPDIVSVLQERSKPSYWNFINYTNGIISVQNPSVEKMLFTYETNNYALPNPDNEAVLQDHCYADKCIIGEHIDNCLSVHNRSIGSLSVLRESLISSDKPHKELLALYDVARRPVEIGLGVPEYFMKYVDKMLAIYRTELTPRRAYL